MARLLKKKSSVDTKNVKKKRRNRGRNKDGGMVSVAAGFCSLSLLLTRLLNYEVVNNNSAVVNHLVGVILGFFGIVGYVIQSHNRMTRHGRIGLVVSVASMLGNAVALFMLYNF